MEKRVCKSCCATKDVEEFDGFKTCNKCREAKRNATKGTRRNITKREEKREQKGANYAKNAGTKSSPKTEMPISMMRYIRTRN